MKVTVPGWGEVGLEHLVSDFSGTLSVDGILLPDVMRKLNLISKFMQIHILTADTHGKARETLADIKGWVHILQGETHSEAKESYVRELGGTNVVAIGNGNNDCRMLAAAGIGVAVCLSEGCAAETARAADLMVTSATDALDLLLFPKRLVATLRK